MQWLEVVRDHGALLQSAKGPVANLADLVAGEPIKGSWWGHTAGHEIFAAIEEVSESPDVVRLRLINGKVTFLHRRLWPAVVRVAYRFPPSALAAIHEEHTASGAHRTTEIAFPEWVPEEVRLEAATLTEGQALRALPEFLR